MQKISFKYSITEFEQLFVEKGLELLYKNTIDTYRLRLHNPKTIIEELVSVCQQAKNGVLTNNDYSTATSKEVISSLKDQNDGLVFKTINREYFIDLIKNTKKENYTRIIQASKLVLRDNENYKDALYTKIEDLLSSYSAVSPIDSEDKKQLLLLTHYLCVELVNLGYTKPYLYNFFRTIFVHAVSTLTFKERYDVWKSLGNKKKEKFKVIYDILGDSFQYRELHEIDSRYEQVNGKYRSTLPSSTSSKVKSFLIARKKNKLISIEVETLDYFKAIEVSRAKLSSDLDLYHLGFNNSDFKLDVQAAVIGENNPEKASTLPSNYQIDGYIRSSREVFEELLDKVRKLKSNNVSDESVDKIISAIRYLRTGSESPELETKLLNYWIGLEYIFTSFNDDEKTIDRMRKYFPICHCLIYIKRNLYDFHKAIERIEISDKITNYDANLEYLGTYQAYKEVIQNASNELMKFRAEFYQKWVSDPGNIKTSLIKHKENLEWNLTRLYRIRNEIVHNAAVKNSIYANVSHLKYYLTFILNSILDFMSNSPTDADNDGRITIDDYFIAQDIILGSLNGKTIKEFLKVRNPLEILH